MEEFFSGIMPIALAVAGTLLALAKAAEVLLRALAPLTRNKRDDRAVRWLDANQNQIERLKAQVGRWADPNNPDVPRAPIEQDQEG